MWKRAGLYGVFLGLGTLVLQWLDYQRLARSHSGDIYVFLIAAVFLVLGVVFGIRFAAPRKAAFAGNPDAVAALGISPRELAVLELIAAGKSNQQIADTLGVSLNTIKTHAARLFEKLGAQRRTDAVARARELGIVR